MVLCVVMLCSSFACVEPGMIDFDFSIKSKAAYENTTIDVITQEHVVPNYEATYAEYAKRLFGGDGVSEPTNIVIPGLGESSNYTPQGMTYWKAKDWILISAYDDEFVYNNRPSVVYALEGTTGKFVALFYVYNEDGSPNTSHGGGIAASEYNFYYADSDSKISYIPLSEMDVTGGAHNIYLEDSIDCSKELNSAATSYCCYDEGVLWTGNFYLSTVEAWAQPAGTYNSMLFGYKLQGNSSEEEWFHLQNKNLLNATATGDFSLAKAPYGELKYNVSINKNRYIDITGNITHDETQGNCGEYAPAFATVQLNHGTTYKLEFDLTTPTMDGITDFYFLRDGGTGSYTNVRYTLGGSTKVSDNGDGTYHYETVLTPGKALVDATGTRHMDGNWDNVDDASGNYSLRFDQDNISTDKAVSITNIHLYEVPTGLGNIEESGKGCEGNPTYCVAFSNNIDRIQYAMVDNGRIYISRSYSRYESKQHVRQLIVGEIDLNSYGTEPLTINGVERYCQYVDDSNMTIFGGAKADSDFESHKNDMLFMGEALCVMEGYLYMFGESAAWGYYGQKTAASDNPCPEPIDVLWRIDQYAIMGELRETDSEKLSYYEPVTSLDDIKNTGNEYDNTDEYIIVYESSQKDPVTQKNILYALDAFGGHDGNKLPKNNISNGTLTDNSKGYTVGIVGHPITEYNIENGNLYLTNPEKDDVENIRWKFSGPEKVGPYQIQSASLYYAKYKNLYFNGLQNFMSEDSSGATFGLDFSVGGGKCYLTASGYYVWCNDGTRGFDDKINAYYKSDANTSGIAEQAGTFHADALNSLAAIKMRNVIGDNIGAENFDLGQFKVYKRVLDDYAEKERSKVYTNSTAELQPDGTYTINMETYAIGPTQYTVLDKQRPTDFIFVLDASGSMTNNTDAIGYHTEYKNWSALKMNQAAGDKDGTFFKDGQNYNTALESNFYYKFPDDQYGKIHVAFNQKDKQYTRNIWLWAEHPVSKRCYRISKLGYLTHGSFEGDATEATDGPYRITEANFLANQYNLGWENEAAVMRDVEDKINRTDYHSRKSDKDDRAAYDVLNYKYTNDYGDTRASYYSYGDCYRLEGMQQAIEKLTYKIADKAAETGLAHRIALVTYGSDSNEGYLNTGMYPNTGVSLVGYTSLNANDHYKNAFFNVNQFSTVRRIINNIDTTKDDPDTYSNYGYEMANNIVSNYSGGYAGGGDRSACIIMITDGIPGLGENKLDVAKTVGDQAIDQAYKVKQKGAYCFSVQIGNNTVWGNMDAYLDYVSSEFIEAKSLSDSGERNPNDIAYRIDIPTGSEFNLNSLVEKMFTNITANSRMALTQLDADSIIRHVLGDGFIAPTQAEMEANLKFKTVPGYYDGLGRLAFRDSDASTAEYDWKYTEDKRTLTVSGYDYTTEYISKGRPETDLGRKLVVSITGILPDSTKKITSEDICDDFQTAIYQSDTQMNNTSEDNDLAFKHFPNESFSIPEYTYVLDYGLQMLDTDVNGTLCSVSDTLSKQSTYKYISENGAVAIDRASRNQNLLYSLSPDKTEQSGYTLIQRDDGTYDWFKINVVPASNVYYEETKMSDGAAGKVAWSTEGSQDTENRLLPSVDDPYGWDNAYNKTSPYSNGTAYKATVNSTNRSSAKKTFQFTGTGFDLVSACGRKTGVLLVIIKDSNGKTVKSYMVDTYYAEGAFGGKDLITQVPVVNWSTENYGTYTVEIAGMYLSSAGAVKETIPKSGLKNKLIDTGLEMNSGKPVDNDAAAKILKDAGLEEFIAEDMELVWFDDNSVLNGGTGVEPTKNGSRGADPGTAVLDNYIDGFRVYNPLGKKAVASGIYSGTEQYATYANVINNLATLENDKTPLAGIAYVDGTLTEGTLGFANYQSVGPKDELYLNGGKKVSFKINVAANEKIMLGLRAVDGAVANVKIGSVDVNKPSNSASYTIQGINSRTEMYYDITDCLHNDMKTAGGEVTITVDNVNDSDMLAINHIKFSGAANSFTGGMSPRSVSRSADTETEVVANRFLPMTQKDLDEIQTVLAGESIPAVVKNGVVTPLVEEEEDVPGDNNQGELPGGDDNEGDVPQDPDNGDSGSGDSSDSTESIFDIFSLLKGLINLIKKILFATVGNESLF